MTSIGGGEGVLMQLYHYLINYIQLKVKHDYSVSVTRQNSFMHFKFNLLYRQYTFKDDQITIIYKINYTLSLSSAYLPCTVAQKRTTVTAYLKSWQLLLFCIAWYCPLGKYIDKQMNIYYSIYQSMRIITRVAYSSYI